MIETFQFKNALDRILLPQQKMYTIEKTLTFSNSALKGTGIVRYIYLRNITRKFRYMYSTFCTSTMHSKYRNYLLDLKQCGLVKIYLIGSKVPVFEKRLKVLYHSTLMNKYEYIEKEQNDQYEITVHAVHRLHTINN